MNLAIARRHPNSTKILEVRSLTPADLELLRTRAHVHAPIKTIRERHHHIAWLLALGWSDIAVAAEVHISPTRISTLRRVPAMADLIGKKRADLESARRDAALNVGTLAMENMAEGEAIVREEVQRLKTLPAGERPLALVNKIVTDRMDRFGYPKKTLSDNRNLNINFAANLEAAIARASKAR